MSSKKCLGYLIDIFTEHNSVRETLGRLELSGTITVEDAASLIASKEEVDDHEGWRIKILDGEYSDLVINDSVSTEVNITVEKPYMGSAYFFTKKGFTAALQNNELEKQHEIHVLGEFHGFKTRRFHVLPWDGEILPLAQDQALTFHEFDPRVGLIRDLTGTVVPRDPYIWMLLGETGAGAIWETWKNIALQKLSYILTSEIWNENGQLMASLNGARRRTFGLQQNTEEFSTTQYLRVCEAVEWLLVPHDAEARHEVLIQRLAALAPENGWSVHSWPDVISQIVPEALDGARLDHRAYIRSQSAESVKAMADLRKVIAEDISKIIEKAHRLSVGFITGVAALAAGLGIRLIMFTGREVPQLLSLTFCVILLGVIWAGLLLQRHVSSKSLANDLKHMRNWHRNTHLALSRSEYAELDLPPSI